jgi:hypothetical protein
MFMTYVPLTHEPWEPFMYGWFFKVWRDYFDFSYDCNTIQVRVRARGRVSVKE